MERRFLSLASVGLEQRVGTDPPAVAIVGFASVFYRADDPGTRIHPLGLRGRGAASSGSCRRHSTPC